MAEPFDPADARTWLARGRLPEHAEELARAWREFPELPPTAPADDRMARSRARVIAMRPIFEAIAAASEGARQRRNFEHLERKAASGGIPDHELAILRGRDAYGYDWNASLCYSQGWYAAHAGWTYGGPTSTRLTPEHRVAYDRGFADGGGDPADLFDAARRSIVAADRRSNQPKPALASIASRPLPSSWPHPTDAPRPTRWSRRLLILADDPVLANGSTLALLDQIRSRPGAEALNIVVVSESGFIPADEYTGQGAPSASSCNKLAQDRAQTERLQALIAGMGVDEILVAAQDEVLTVIDAHASALPLCRTMERTRNTVLQQRLHLRTWLERAAPEHGNAGSGHIRWSKVIKGLTGKLGEFTVRYAGKADTGGHIIAVETTTGKPAFGFVTADRRELSPRITFGNKARMRQEMAAALRLFAGATAFVPVERTSPNPAIRGEVADPARFAGAAEAILI